jgi:cell division protein ZapA (FtsZ GTPase activity inhibitor)
MDTQLLISRLDDARAELDSNLYATLKSFIVACDHDDEPYLADTAREAREALAGLEPDDRQTLLDKLPWLEYELQCW